MSVFESRSNVEGFELSTVQDTSTHAVEVGTVSAGEQPFVVTLIQRLDLVEACGFLISKVADSKNVEIWNFRQEQSDGVGVLAKAGDEFVIALVGRGKQGNVERVIPLASIGSHLPIGVMRKIELKRLAAENLNRGYAMSAEEKKLFEINAKRVAAEREAQAKAEAERRQAEREERISRMLKRGQVTGFTIDGKKRHGLPVLEGEWASCTNGTFVITVKSVNDETGEIGELIEAFQVVKGGGKNPQKGNRAPVMPWRPGTQPKAIAVQSMGTAFIEKDGDAFEVRLYESMDQIKLARSLGLNGGTYVAPSAKSKGGKISVYAVFKDRIDTIGDFAPIE